MVKRRYRKATNEEWLAVGAAARRQQGNRTPTRAHAVKVGVLGSLLIAVAVGEHVMRDKPDGSEKCISLRELRPSIGHDMYIGLLQRSAKLPDCPNDRPWFVGLEARRHPRRHHLLGAFRRDLRSLRSLRLHHSLPGGDLLGTGNKVVVGCGHGYRC